MKFFALIFAMTTLSLFSHEIELRRDTSVELFSCSREDQSQQFPQTQAYIQRIAQKIMSSNPEVFDGDLSSENICISLDPVQSQRAWADARQRSFKIDAGLLLRAQNDDQIAFTMSHEFSHIALRHAPLEGNPIPYESREDVNQLILEKERTYQCLLAAGKNPELIEEIHAQLSRLSNSISEIFNHYYDEEFEANWMETEADVTGAHYHLHAGYNPAEVTWRFEQMVVGMVRAGLDPRTNVAGAGFDPHGPPSELSIHDRERAAMDACGLRGPNPPAPPRGTHRYPMPCWQIWNLKINLPKTNPQYAELFSRPHCTSSESSQELLIVKAELCGNERTRHPAYCN